VVKEVDGVAVELRNVSKSFGRVRVLDSVSLTARRGEVHVIVGPNGVGKTTLLKIIAGVLRPDSGEVMVRGSVALVPQGDSLLPWRTALRNITLPLELSGLDGVEAREAARRVAEGLGISRYLDMYPRELSGGTRRKVAIARALVTNPDVLLLDEPYNGLDVDSVRSLNETIRGLSSGGRTIILVSHQVAEAAEVADSFTAITGRPGRVTASMDVRGLGPEEGARAMKAALGVGVNGA
jgi:ABC-type nitrate/sulfonate/bicarbonate transport system, ATPase component